MKSKSPFSAADEKQIDEQGLTIAALENQLAAFRRGFPPAKLIRAASLQNGIIEFGTREQQQLVHEFEENASDYLLARFIPASGAATRMFKDLYLAAEAIHNNWDIPANALKFLSQLNQFAFFDELNNVLKKNSLQLDDLLSNKNYLPILNAVLKKEGLNFGAKPKAFIPFHCYKHHSRTAVEEQIYEGLTYAIGSKKTLNIHFTISPEHEKEFKSLTRRIVSDIKEKSDVIIKITHSFQQRNTDTIAVDMDNIPVRDRNEKLVFRPGGHGALLQNLNDLKAEMVFLKNIDNIVPDWHREDTIWFKKVIGGFLMQLVNDIHAFLIMLDDGNVDDSDLNEMMTFAEEKLYATIPEWLRESDPLEKMDFLFEFFNRPVRVCGMVKNEGEPGGGPFFVEDSNGNISLQIVESSQVDIKDAKQKKILLSATHFNPVDLVCWKNDFRGSPFDLNDFSDPEMGFIAVKSFEGKDIKAMELPGLWNGAMANWITLFVEVPLSTFNPVKEINDLLREKHK